MPWENVVDLPDQDHNYDDEYGKQGGRLQHDGLFDGAFETYDKNTGFAYSAAASNRAKADPILIGWGNFDQPGGYSPITKAPGVRPTGMLADGAPWSYNFFGDETNGFHQEKSEYWTKQDYRSRTVGAIAIYARIPLDVGLTNAEIQKYNWVYLRGRLYHGVGMQ
jgi:hypothetical protein